MRNTIIFSLALLLFAAVCLAQPSLVWQRSLGGSFHDEAYSIQQTSDGEFIVAGWSASNDGDVSGHHGSTDYSDSWVVKLNSAGDIEWQKCLGGSDWDYAYSIQQTSDSGFIVAGASNSNDGDVSGNHGYGDYWVAKLNSAGALVWQRALGGSDEDEASSIQQTSDGGFIVAGYSYSNDGDVSGNHGNGDYWVVKLNSAGDIEWQKCLGGSDWDYAYSIQQTSDGGFIVAGWSSSNDGDVSGNHGYDDYWVVKLDSSGDIEWQKSLGGSDWDEASSIQQTTDGGYIVAGASESNDGDVSGNHGSYDYWVVRLNSAGALVWQRALGGSDEDEASSIQQTSDGGYIVAGYSYSNDGDVSGHHESTDESDYWVAKLNSAGALVWQRSFGGSGGDGALSIQQTSDSGFIVAGGSASNDGDVSGWHEGYDSYGDPTSDYWVVKLSPEEGISEGNEGLQPLAYTISAYPNPFNSSCEITLSGVNKGACSLVDGTVEIYDLRGNVVFTNAVGARSPRPMQKGAETAPLQNGARTFIWHPNKSIASGIYLVRATTDDGRTTTKRVILIK